VKAELGWQTDSDIGRGSYARWDATEGDCLVRVAAYNDDSLITNEWLFGLAGDKKPAEQWMSAGSSFACKAATFEFNLMNWTKNAAVVGTVGGTALGASIGAIAGAASNNVEYKLENCKEAEFRSLLSRALRTYGMTETFKTYEECYDWVNSHQF
jgi:hypothetical protein